MKENTYISITLIWGFYVNYTYRQVLRKIWISQQPSGRSYSNNLREKRAGDPGSNPGPGENFSLKLLIYDLPDGYSENQIFIKTCLYV